LDQPAVESMNTEPRGTNMQRTPDRCMLAREEKRAERRQRAESSSEEEGRRQRGVGGLRCVHSGKIRSQRESCIDDEPTTVADSPVSDSY
jgi:hypothetical protein